MTRQELAAQRFPYPQYAKIVSKRQKIIDKLQIDKKRSIFIDGMEAWLKEMPLEGIEAQQSPTDAVAFVNWIEINRYELWSTGNWGLAGTSEIISENTTELYQLFKPSGAAPQTKDPFIEKHLGKIKELQAHYAEVSHPPIDPVSGYAILLAALDKIAHSTTFPSNTEQAYEWIKTTQETAYYAIKAYNTECRAPQADCPTDEDGEFNCPVLDAVYEGAAQWEGRCRDAEAALKELVDLKAWKERNGKDAIYTARRPAAWGAAQIYLATYFEEYEIPKNEK